MQMEALAGGVAGGYDSTPSVSASVKENNKISTSVEHVEKNARNAVVLPGAISINPLNRKLDESYAPSRENGGSLAVDEKTGVRLVTVQR